MSEAKLEIKVGSISFIGEGASTWLSQQLDKVLDRLPDLVNLDPGTGGDVIEKDDITPKSRGKKAGTLAAFLKEKKATSNQVRKFLATATWLHDSGSQKRVSTKEVVAALNDNNQGKLRNPAQCLIRNTSRGLVTKDGRQFYVNDEGRMELEK